MDRQKPAKILPHMSLALYGAGASFCLYLILTNREIVARAPGILEYGISFRLNPLSCLFILVASVAWFFAGLFSIPYLESTHAAAGGKHDRGAGAGSGSPQPSDAVFHWAFVLSFLFTTGVFASGDYLTLFLFFELLTLSSYVLVRYEGTPEAQKAGELYLYMSLAGGLSVLAGILLISWYTGSFSFSAFGSLPHIPKLVALIFLLAGFGVKAGIPGLNVWLPEAHPVAPSPASAVLSGVMIKVGAYGIIVTFSELGESPWRYQAFLALALLGICDIWWGGLRALREDNLKRILAFSSVSQMGYVLVAAGVAGAFLPQPAHVLTGSAAPSLGLSGALYHVIAHSLYKACLFLVAGAALLSRGSLSLKDLKGVARRSPWISLGTIAAVLAITGFPGFPGFVSKTLIHEALLEAIHASPTGQSVAAFLEKGFVWGSYLTGLYFGRVLIYLCGPSGKSGNRAERGHRSVPAAFAAVFAGYFLLLLLTGISPGRVLDLFVTPATAAVQISPGEETHLRFFTSETFAPVATGYVVAGTILLASEKLRGLSGGSKTGTLLDLYQNRLPRAGAMIAGWFFRLNAFVDEAYSFLGKSARNVVGWFVKFEEITQASWAVSGHAAFFFVHLTYQGDHLDATTFTRLKDAFLRSSFAVGRLDAGEDRLVRSAGKVSGKLIRWMAGEETSFERSLERGARAAACVPVAAGRIDEALNSESQAAARGAESLVGSASRLVQAARPEAVQEWLDRTTTCAVVRASWVLIWMTLGIVVMATGVLLLVR